MDLKIVLSLVCLGMAEYLLRKSLNTLLPRMKFVYAHEASSAIAFHYLLVRLKIVVVCDLNLSTRRKYAASELRRTQG